MTTSLVIIDSYESSIPTLIFQENYLEVPMSLPDAFNLTAYLNVKAHVLFDAQSLFIPEAIYYQYFHILFEGTVHYKTPRYFSEIQTFEIERYFDETSIVYKLLDEKYSKPTEEFLLKLKDIPFMRIVPK